MRWLGSIVGRLYLSQRDLTDPSEREPGQATAVLGRLAPEELEESSVVMDINKKFLTEPGTVYSHTDAKEKNWRIFG